MEVSLPTECAVCRRPLASLRNVGGGSIIVEESIDPVLLPETATPGLEAAGDPLRILGWHRVCAPAWALEREAWLEYQRAPR